MAECENYVRALGQTADAQITTCQRGGNYPFPQRKAFYYTTVESIPDFDPIEQYPHVRGRIFGAHLFRVLELNPKRRNVDIRLSSGHDRWRQE